MLISEFKELYLPTIKTDNLVGDFGKPVKTTHADIHKIQKGNELHKFNEFASSLIPLLRHLPEKRKKSCLKRRYPKYLPTASIIITYYNEALSTLLRTLHSALSRSPPQFIKEIIMIDDNSDHNMFPHLKEISLHLKHLKNIKLVTSTKRLGLIKARQLGAELSTGEILIFLDSHCECFEGWIEPLLSGIKDNSTRIITPVLVIIDRDTFEITSDIVETISIGTITSTLSFNWYYSSNQSSHDHLVRYDFMQTTSHFFNMIFFCIQTKIDAYILHALKNFFILINSCAVPFCKLCVQYL
ncbi:hypothetical protein MXB_4838 [Myxobolus squamalis]|nr:hypothetical protein MXB_4838 [Myxobolus squamalis]